MTTKTKTKTKTDKLQARVDSLELELLQVLKHQPELLEMLRQCETVLNTAADCATDVSELIARATKKN